MQRTRRQILDILKRRGKASLEELANAVELVPVTVRAHLSVLERDDLVQAEETRGKVGRPFFVYSLTPAAQELFPRSYHKLADRLLSAVSDVYGTQGVEKVLERSNEVWLNDKMPRLQGKDLPGRVAELAQIRSEEGALAEWEKTPEGYVLHAFNCPTFQVATAHPELCDSELECLQRALDNPIERVSSIAQGDNKCSYLVRTPGLE